MCYFLFFYSAGITTVLELNIIENSDKRWEAKFPLDEQFIGDPNSVKVFKRNSHIIIEKRIPIPSEVQQTTVSAYLKGSDTNF